MVTCGQRTVAPVRSWTISLSRVRYARRHAEIGTSPRSWSAYASNIASIPSEMEAMFEAYADQLRGEVPISAWRRAYRTRESEIVQLLTGATVRWPQVTIGSYPRFLPDGPEVEVVLKSADAAALAAAVAWLEPALADVVSRPG